MLELISTCNNVKDVYKKLMEHEAICNERLKETFCNIR